MNTPYFRPIVQRNVQRSRSAVALAGGPLWFDHVCVMQRDEAPHVISASDLPSHVLDSLSGSRPSISDLSFDRPRIMAILNATLVVFQMVVGFDPKHAVAQARRLWKMVRTYSTWWKVDPSWFAEVPVDEEIKQDSTDHGGVVRSARWQGGGNAFKRTEGQSCEMTLSVALA